jgi:ribosomal protein L19
LKQGKVRRAKLYYLRHRMGKEATNVKDANAASTAQAASA